MSARQREDVPSTSRHKPNRRWLQFSLRSVLILTLAVALWLGHEVRQARHVEQTVAALRELGGNAECELTGWSLLRLCRVSGYGLRIVRAEMSGSAAEQAIELLRGSPGLRELQVKYDGTYDPAPSWKVLLGSLPNVSVMPVAEEGSGYESSADLSGGHQPREQFVRCLQGVSAHKLGCTEVLQRGRGGDKQPVRLDDANRS
jgi:hypothetical protein